jgi:hypothetical protein
MGTISIIKQFKGQKNWWLTHVCTRNFRLKTENTAISNYNNGERTFLVEKSNHQIQEYRILHLSIVKLQHVATKKGYCK